MYIKLPEKASYTGNGAKTQKGKKKTVLTVEYTLLLLKCIVGVTVVLYQMVEYQKFLLRMRIISRLICRQI